MVTHPDGPTQLRGPRGDRPGRRRAAGKAHAVVVDPDGDLSGQPLDSDRGRIRLGMPPDVASTLEHDLQGMLDQWQRPVKLRSHPEAGPGCRRTPGRCGLPVEERPDVGTELVVLAV